MFCSSCGTSVDPNDRLCPQCRYPVTPPPRLRRYDGGNVSDCRDWWHETELTSFEAILCLLLPGLGLVFGVLRLLGGRVAARKMIGYSLLSGGVWSASVWLVLCYLGGRAM